MTIKTGSQDALQGGGKVWGEEVHTFQWDAVTTIAELPTSFTEVYDVQLTLVKPDAVETASGQIQMPYVLPIHTPGGGTIGALSVLGVITPAITSAGVNVLPIARQVEGAGTLDTDSRVMVRVKGRA